MTDAVRLFDLAAAEKPRKHPPTHCWCGQAASDGKDRCLAHVLERPYAAAIVAALEDRDEEIRQVLRRGPRAVPDDSIVLEDLRGLLHHLGETTTLERVAWHLRSELDAAGDVEQRHKVLSHYLNALVRLGEARWVRPRRGRQTIQILTPPEALSA